MAAYIARAGAPRQGRDGSPACGAIARGGSVPLSETFSGCRCEGLHSYYRLFGRRVRARGRRAQALANDRSFERPLEISVFLFC